MTHADDNGLVAPPRLAPIQVVIVPIWKSDEEKSQVSGVGGQVKTVLQQAGIRAKLDLRENMKPGAKYFDWEARGVPVRLEVGPRDVAAGPPGLARPPGGHAAVEGDGGAAAGGARRAQNQTGPLPAAKDRPRTHTSPHRPKRPRTH